MDSPTGADGPRPGPGETDPGFQGVLDYLLFGLSLPERAVRSVSGLAAGAVRESASLLVPRAFRNSKTYNILIQQMLDFLAEDVGRVERAADADTAPKVEAYVARKAVGNFVEMASLATLHLSPMLLLAVVSDTAYGSRSYLKELAEILKQQGVIAEDSTVDRLDDLLDAVAMGTKTAATALDTPPLSVKGLHETVRQTREAVARIDPTAVLPQAELVRLWKEIHQTAASQGVNPLAVSGAMTLYALDKIADAVTGALSTVRAAGTLLDRHVIDHYREALGDIAHRGIYVSLSESAQPYIDAVWLNFSRQRDTFTESLFDGRAIGSAWAAVSRWLGYGPPLQPGADAACSPASETPVLLRFDAADESDTRRLAEALAGVLPAGTVVGLHGTLGAGKTRLVQALAAAHGIDPLTVTSPTFVLIHQYRGRRDLFHFDAYRVRDDDEFLELGVEEYFEGDGLSLVEWADKVENCLPPERIDIRIEVTGATSRRFEIAALGDRFRAAIEQLRPLLLPEEDPPSGAAADPA